LEIETDSRKGISMAHFASKSVGADKKKPWGISGQVAKESNAIYGSE